MQSCIYEGRVHHRRYQPITHAFSYRLAMMYLDLEEIPDLFSDRWFWSQERFNLATFRRSDYHGDPTIPLDTAVRNKVEAIQGTRPAGPIRLLTHLRYFGHCFNPVSFYYCYDQGGHGVETIMAEVTNTPWMERHAYVLRRTEALEETREMHFRFQKDFHVSPFIDMDQQYDWFLSPPGPSLHVRMINTQAGAPFFEANLHVKRQEISGKSLARVLASIPPMTLKVVGAIYWQALRLKIKGADFHTHPPQSLSTGKDTHA